MEEDDLTTNFNASLTNLSSSSSNYQTLVNTNNRNNNDTLLNNESSPPPQAHNLSSSTQQQQQQQLNNSSSSSINNPDQCPFAVFLFRSNSGVEMYEERRIMLDRACKIGRSVAKVRPEPNNAIFDCKVLSRNHALLWHENNKVNL